MKKAKSVGIQYAALPYRLVGRRVEILLITSRGTRRWVIPKGWPMQGLRPQEAAAVEAAEEAGLIGQIEDRPIGSYRYIKALKGDQTIAVQVILFPLLVTGQHDSWKEEGQRESNWFRYQQAANLVAEPSLRRLIRQFGQQRTPGVFARAWRLRLTGRELLHLH
jgi:8-oxo-dGTP pyrophosphatase MutT (NUDIX family)